MLKSKKKWSLKEDFRKRWQLYIMLLIPTIFVLVFSYLPMGGIAIAFREFSFRKGIFGGEFVGLKYFKLFLGSPDFELVLKNTIILSLYSLVASFPVPIILALALHIIGVNWYKKFMQTLTYVPYFISTVVMVGIIMRVFDLNTGFINNFFDLLGFERFNFLGKGKLFRHIYVWSGIWQSAGYSAILYIATLGNVDQSLIEATQVDGANLLQRIFVVELPTLKPIVTIQLILALGGIMSVGFDKAFLLQNSLNLQYSELISTLVYKRGMTGAQYSYATAVGLFNSVINFILLIVTNQASKRFGETSLF